MSGERDLWNETHGGLPGCELCQWFRFTIRRYEAAMITRNWQALTDSERVNLVQKHARVLDAEAWHQDRFHPDKTRYAGRY